MADSIEVICVDGVGTPRIIALVGELPDRFGWARPYQATGPGRIVQFERQALVEIDGMAVYRQAETGEPRIRFEYLKPLDQPFNQPRVTP